MDEDRSTYLSQADAAARLGLRSVKGVQRLVAAGDLVQYTRPNPRGGPQACYFPGDVDDLAAKRAADGQRAIVVPGPVAPTIPASSNGHGPLVRIPGAEEIAALVRAVSQTLSQTSQTDKPAYVSLDDALHLSGLSRAELQKAVAAGEVKVRGRRYRRADVEAL